MGEWFWMDEYGKCPRCGCKTKLDNNLEIFESGDNYKLIYSGKCNKCEILVEKCYPLTKGDPTWPKSYILKIMLLWKNMMKALNAPYVDFI